jgi:serine/threonine protein kinase
MSETLPIPGFFAFEVYPIPFAAEGDGPYPVASREDVRFALSAFGFTLVDDRSMHCSANSTVYVARDPMQQTCAVKLSSNSKRLMREYQNRCALGEFPYLVATHDIFVGEHYSVLHMELCPERDIHGKALSEPHCWTVLVTIGRALAHIHRLGFVHLDVSASNIFRAGDRFKLGDFGTLRAVAQFKIGDEGAGPYAAPEVLNWEEGVSTPADIFSLGICLLEAASGFYAPRGGDRRYRAIRDGSLGLGGADYPCGFSRGFVEVVNQMLRQDPMSRPTAAQLVQAGERALR